MFFIMAFQASFIFFISHFRARILRLISFFTLDISPIPQKINGNDRLPYPSIVSSIRSSTWASLWSSYQSHGLILVLSLLATVLSHLPLLNFHTLGMISFMGSGNVVNAICVVLVIFVIFRISSYFLKLLFF